MPVLSGHHGKVISLTPLNLKVQRRAARYIHNNYCLDTSVLGLIGKLNWDSLELHRIKSSLIMFYKMTHNLAAIPYRHYIQPASISSTRLSHQFKILPLSSAKNPFKFSFIARTIPTWNSLSDYLVNSDSTNSFKSKLGTLLSSCN